MEDRTKILAFGVTPGSLLSDQDEVATFPEPVGGVSWDELMGTFTEAEQVSLVALYPDWLEEAGLGRLQATASMLEAARLAVYRTALPPVGTAVLASLASRLKDALPSAGALVGALPALERELYVAAWMRSVTRLADPAPTMLQHFASLVPSTEFGVVMWPEPSVERLAAQSRTVPAPRLRSSLALAVSGSDQGISWIESQVAPALGDPPISRLEASDHRAAAWGTAEVTEAVGYPASAEALAERIGEGLRLRECGWCGEVIAASRCPFCGHAD